MIAQFEGQKLAESYKTRTIDNRHYFPMEDVPEQTLVPKGEAIESSSPAKGKPFYYDVITANGTLEKGAWTYPNAPAEPLINFSNYITFCDEIALKER